MTRQLFVIQDRWAYRGEGPGRVRGVPDMGDEVEGELETLAAPSIEGCGKDQVRLIVSKIKRSEETQNPGPSSPPSCCSLDLDPLDDLEVREFWEVRDETEPEGE